MDTSEYPSLPNLNRLHTRLAANCQRVESVIDSQLDGIERLFSATVAEDWSAVAEASRLLSEQKSEFVGPDVIREARYVFDELRHEAGGAKQPKHLASLLAACRAVREQQ